MSGLIRIYWDAAVGLGVDRAGVNPSVCLTAFAQVSLFYIAVDVGLTGRKHIARNNGEGHQRDYHAPDDGFFCRENLEVFH